MKKLSAILISLVLVILTLVACDNNNNVDTNVVITKDTSIYTIGNTSNGQVYYLNFKPEADAAWQKLAKTYTDLTGVPVKVVTAASDQYEATLAEEMKKPYPPTLFQVNGPVTLAKWKNRCYDLSDTELYKNLTSDSFSLKDGKKTLAIAYVIESYGIIVNKKLLKEAGYSIDDIKSFEDLKRVATDINNRKEELGFTAFTSAGMDPSSEWRFKTHLANLPIYFEYEKRRIKNASSLKGTYLDNYRAIWDLYINNSTIDPQNLLSKNGDNSRNEFIDKKAVFYQNGSWEYNGLNSAGLADEDLAIIPIYIGVGDEENQGLCTGTENYWCVNKKAGDKNVEATLNFLSWCVTSEVGVSAMANDMGFVIPFKEALPSPNLFVRQDTEYTRKGKKPVSWCFTTMPSEEWKNGVGRALSFYAADQSDETWKEVVKAFVDGWKQEYNRAKK